MNSGGSKEVLATGDALNHTQPLKLGGADALSNMQSQSTNAAKAKDKRENNRMKQYLSLTGLSSAFNLLWKILLLLNLAWIGQSLHVIATNVQFGDQRQGEFDPNQKEGGTDFDQSQICPKAGPEA